MGRTDTEGMGIRRGDRTGIACVVICQTLYGFSFMAAKIGTGLTDPVSLLAWRFTTALAVMLILIRAGLIKTDIRRKGIRPLIALSVFTPFLNYLLETIGISMTSSSESGVMVASLPIMCMISSSVILGKPPKRRQSLGIAITVTGAVVCILANGFDESFHTLGNLLVIISVGSNSIYVALSEKAEVYTSSEKTLVMLATGALSFTLTAIVIHIMRGDLREFLTLPLENKGFMAAILYLGIACSMIAFLLNNTAISIIGTTRTSSFGGISTIVSIFAGMILLGEPFSARQAAGTAMVLSGAYIANAGLNKKH